MNTLKTDILLIFVLEICSFLTSNALEQHCLPQDLISCLSKKVHNKTIIVMKKDHILEPLHHFKHTTLPRPHNRWHWPQFSLLWWSFVVGRRWTAFRSRWRNTRSQWRRWPAQRMSSRNWAFMTTVAASPLIKKTMRKCCLRNAHNNPLKTLSEERKRERVHFYIHGHFYVSNQPPIFGFILYS